MKISDSGRYAFGTCVAVALLAGCGSAGSQSQLGPSGLGSSGLNAAQPGTDLLSRLSDMSTLAVKPGPPHPDHHRSWVSPDVRKARSLLFVSDFGTYDVYIYTLPGLVLKGTLTGFYAPDGECSDKDGNIWVTNSGTQQIFKLSRGGTILNTLNTGFDPASCAVDPTTGNLAVTDLTGNSAGEVLIYPNASGTPTVYTNPAQFYYDFDGYDSSGNLFVDGFAFEEPGGVNLNYLPFILSELPKGGSSLETINITGCAHVPQCGNIYYPGMVQWYGPGNYLAVGDQLAATHLPLAYIGSRSRVQPERSRERLLCWAPRAIPYATWLRA
jgi:hypothetical protein